MLQVHDMGKCLFGSTMAQHSSCVYGLFLNSSHVSLGFQNGRHYIHFWQNHPLVPAGLSEPEGGHGPPNIVKTFNHISTRGSHCPRNVLSDPEPMIWFELVHIYVSPFHNEEGKKGLEDCCPTNCAIEEYV